MKTLADLTAPAPVVRKLLEKDVQKQCVEWARGRGYWARKFSSQSQRSVPDYLFAGAHRPTDRKHKCRHAQTCFPGECSCCAWLPALKFACEFKRPGNAPTTAQLDEMESMRKAGWLVFWCYDFEQFKAVVTQMERQAS